MPSDQSIWQNDITLVSPSRGRPARYKNMLDSARRNAARPFYAYLYLDSDDPTKNEYPQSDETMTRIEGPPVRSAKALYSLIEQVKTPFFMIAADDTEFMTQQWDRLLIKSMPADQMAIVSAYTSFKNSDGHFLASMKWHRMLELFPKDAFVHFGPDGWALDVAKRAGRFIQRKDVIIDHHHFKNRKAEYDATYQLARSGNDSTMAQQYLDRHVDVRERHAQMIKEEIERCAGKAAA